MPRRLDPEEEAIWARVTQGVRPLHPAPQPIPVPSPPIAPRPRAGAQSPPSSERATHRPAAETLDSSWDRRLASGRTRPDRLVDLHGLTRSQARQTLIRAIDRAESRGERLLLVITGKGSTPGPAPADLMADRAVRGAIRADLPRWLGEPALSSRIAAVRQAPGRKGGQGAVWLVLRRARAPGGAGAS